MRGGGEQRTYFELSMFQVKMLVDELTKRLEGFQIQPTRVTRTKTPESSEEDLLILKVNTKRKLLLNCLSSKRHETSGNLFDAKHAQCWLFCAGYILRGVLPELFLQGAR